MYLALEEGRISAYSSSGSPQWTAQLTAKPGTPALSPSGRTLAIGSADWVVQRFILTRSRAGESPPQEKPAAPPALFRTGEDALWRKDLDYLYLVERAESPYKNRKIEGLEALETRLAGGKFGLSLDYAPEILRRFALSRSPAGTGSLTDIQERALKTLGAVGGPHSQSFLAESLAAQKDSALTPAILSAMSSLRGDPGEVMREALFRHIEASPAAAAKLSGLFIAALDELSLYNGSLGQYGRAALFQFLPLVNPAQKNAIQALLKKRT
jgi:hypothetical protein